MSLATKAPPAVRPLVEFIEARLTEREPDDDPLGVLLLNALGLLVADVSSIVPANAIRNDWAREVLQDMAYLFADHDDYRPQWLPMPVRHR